MGQGNKACATNAAHLHSLPCTPEPVLPVHLRSAHSLVWGQCHPLSVTVHQSVPLEILQGVEVPCKSLCTC